MKLALNVAARPIPSSSPAPVASRRFTRRLSWAGLPLLGGLMLWSGAALALDGIDLSQPGVAAELAGSGRECPRLIQIKYPFLACTNGQIGSSSGDDTWDNSRRIPIQASFVEGDGYFGPNLNED